MLALFQEETKEVRKEALQTGRQEAFLEVAENMLRSGYGIAKVCKLTTLEREQVEAINRSLDYH